MTQQVVHINGISIQAENPDRNVEAVQLADLGDFPGKLFHMVGGVKIFVPNLQSSFKHIVKLDEMGIPFADDAIQTVGQPIRGTGMIALAMHEHPSSQ